MKFIDTNIFLRFLTDDDPAIAKRCEDMFKLALKKNEPLYTTDTVIVELVWVLESYYGLSKQAIREKIEKILNTPNLQCPHKDLLFECISLYTIKNIDFVDAYNALIMREKDIKIVYSYDTHFDRISWIKKIEP